LGASFAVYWLSRPLLDLSSNLDLSTRQDHLMAAEQSNQTGAALDQSVGSTGSAHDIKEHMEVYASCGTKIGKVDHVRGDQIKLTKNDSSDGQHHMIPTSWVAKVHDHIHLSKDHKQVEAEWQTA